MLSLQGTTATPTKCNAACSRRNIHTGQDGASVLICQVDGKRRRWGSKCRFRWAKDGAAKSRAGRKPAPVKPQELPKLKKQHSTRPAQCDTNGRLCARFVSHCLVEAALGNQKTITPRSAACYIDPGEDQLGIIQAINPRGGWASVNLSDAA
jgi:hypothetical protein